jgi:hypothetical protein
MGPTAPFLLLLGWVAFPAFAAGALIVYLCCARQLASLRSDSVNQQRSSNLTQERQSTTILNLQRQLVACTNYIHTQHGQLRQQREEGQQHQDELVDHFAENQELQRQEALDQACAVARRVGSLRRRT